LDDENFVVANSSDVPTNKFLIIPVEEDDWWWDETWKWGLSNNNDGQFWIEISLPYSLSYQYIEPFYIDIHKSYGSQE
jgi:hypothetical protein